MYEAIDSLVDRVRELIRTRSELPPEPPAPPPKKDLLTVLSEAVFGPPAQKHTPSLLDEMRIPIADFYGWLDKCLRQHGNSRHGSPHEMQMRAKEFVYQLSKQATHCLEGKTHLVVLDQAIERAFFPIRRERLASFPEELTTQRERSEEINRRHGEWKHESDTTSTRLQAARQRLAQIPPAETLKHTLLPENESRAVADVVRLRLPLQAFLAKNDYLAIGNLVIETLMRPGQDQSPDGGSKLIDEFMPQVVRQFCGIPKGLAYPRPFSDRHVAFAERGTWEKDRFRELVILAYMVGATIQNLPLTYAKIQPLLISMAAEQKAAIYEAYHPYVTAHPVTDPGRPPCTCHQCIEHHPGRWAEHEQFWKQQNAHEAWVRACGQAWCDAHNARQAAGDADRIYRQAVARMEREEEHERRLEDQRREAAEREQAQLAKEERARKQAEAEAGLGESEMAKQIRDVMASDMDDSSMRENIEYIIRHFRK